MLRWLKTIQYIYCTKKIELTLLLTAGTCLLISILLIFNSNNQPSVNQMVMYEDSNNDQEKLISVDVSGAVQIPDVYDLPEGTRLKALIGSAGGLKENADFMTIQKQFNFAAVLKDQQKIYFPYLNDNKASSGAINEVDLISVNSAAKSNLMSLAGIGEQTAEKIIAGRPYQDLNELIERKIIGKSLFERIENNISL